MQKHEFIFEGNNATVIIPDNFHGEWIWKTEFLYAFDQAERALTDEGYARVYYEISDRYGSYKAVRMMHSFYRYVIEKFQLNDKCHLFGFSRGGLYAFNFALYYPEYVASVYLDAPVLDMKSWPLKGSIEQAQLFEEYTLTAATLKKFKDNPVDNLEEFFSLNIPLLLIAGGKDELVDFSQNSGKVIAYCKQKGIAIDCIVKENCGHHPHSLENVQPIIEFIKRGIK